MSNQSDHIIHKEFLNSLIAGNRILSSSIVQDYLKQQGSVQDLYEEIIKEALYEIGDLWENNKISVATEHLASAIVEAILNELYQKIISKDKVSKTAIVACVQNEFHQIGVKMVSDVFEMNGWNTYFLGANVPTIDLVKYAKTINPDMLAISLSMYSHLPILENMIQIVRNDFPDLSILVGGQAFKTGGQSVLLKYKKVIYQPDLHSTDQFIKSIK